MGLFLAEIRRYPVKSMAGEKLQTARLSEEGVDGDRAIQVYEGRGRIATSRTFPGLLGFHATLGANGVTIDGKDWKDESVLAAVRGVVGPGATLRTSPDRFDILPLLVATDGAIAAFGRDVRRLRPNLVIGGVDGLDERRWEGRELRIGDVTIGIHDLRGRCVMTTYDPDTLEQDRNVLRDIVQRFEGKLALNCEVLRGGTIEVGQTVELE